MSLSRVVPANAITSINAVTELQGIDYYDPETDSYYVMDGRGKDRRKARRERRAKRKAQRERRHEARTLRKEGRVEMQKARIEGRRGRTEARRERSAGGGGWLDKVGGIAGDIFGKDGGAGYEDNPAERLSLDIGNEQETFFDKNKTLIIGGGVAIGLLGLAAATGVFSKKKGKKR